jgi:hypothetical protein
MALLYPAARPWLRATSAPNKPNTQQIKPWPTGFPIFGHAHSQNDHGGRFVLLQHRLALREGPIIFHFFRFSFFFPSIFFSLFCLGERRGNRPSIPRDDATRVSLFKKGKKKNFFFFIKIFFFPSPSSLPSPSRPSLCLVEWQQTFDYHLGHYYDRRVPSDIREWRQFLYVPS